MIQGKAFLTDRAAPGKPILTFKNWVDVNGRALLVEQAPYWRVRPALAALPAAPAGAASGTGSAARGFSFRDILPLPHLARVGKHGRILARVSPAGRRTHTEIGRLEIASADSFKKPGLDWDYITVGAGATNWVFQGGTTYLIDGDDFYLYGSTTLEGGAVIKGGGVIIEENGSIDCRTGPYNVCVFTSPNDNGIGVNVANSTGSPDLEDVWGPYLTICTTNTLLNDLRFCYAWTAVDEESAPNTIDLWDCQFLDVATGVSGYDIGLFNDLFGYSPNDASELRGYTDPEVGVGQNLVAENVTADSGCSFASANGSGVVLALTNCLITSEPITNSSYYIATVLTNADVYLPSPTAPVYQVVGAGSYYLTNNSPYRGYGTANIDSGLLADLQTRTTWPPEVYNGTSLTSAATLGPSAPRNTNSSPDIGYCYAPLDYVFGGCSLDTNLTFAAGTAVGWFLRNDGDQGFLDSIGVYGGGRLAFDGNASEPCYFSRHTMVQEGGNGNWNDNTNTQFSPGAVTLSGSSTNNEPFVSGDFTKWTTDAGNYPVFCGDYFEAYYACGSGGFNNCEFYNGEVATYGAQYLNFTNCLFSRDFLYFQDPNWALAFSVENCTFYGGCLVYNRYSGEGGDLSSIWLIENCSFDGTAFAWADNSYGANLTCGYNAYNTNNLSWEAYPFTNQTLSGVNEYVAPRDVMVTNYDWQTNWFGDFYLPADSPLLYRGSARAGTVGLFHFTTQASQVPDGTNVVTIGYHYVAINGSGNPLDSNGDGVPDYLEDANGDGLADDGETNWAIAILSQPTSQTVTQDSNATFSVVADGVPQLTYQWYWNGAPLSDGAGVSGSGTSNLTLSAVQPDQAGNYQVVAADAFGSVTSVVAVLTVSALADGISSNAYWNVTDISDPAHPVNIGELQGPFSEPFYVPNTSSTVPKPNSPWHTNTTVSLSIAYGAAEFGGSAGLGTIFQVGLDGTNFSVIHAFNGQDGAHPCSQLATSGSSFYGIPVVLYGTTSGGGADGCGTVFKVNADGTGFTNLYAFTGGADGNGPQTGLLISGNTLYGTTTNSIFKINTDGSDFACLTNINNASRLVLSLSGDELFGTTSNGGAYGFGSVFRINTDGSGLTNLYSFPGGAGGQYPASGLELYGIGMSLANGPTNGTLYGTTYSGGASNDGMAFSISTDGTGFNDMHDFSGANDGQNPVGDLYLPNNNAEGNTATGLYGTTSAGGGNGGGTLFRIGLDGSGFSTLYSFDGGFRPVGKLVSEFATSIGGTLFGTSSEGGAGSNGVAFAVNTDGTGFRNLYQFTGGTDGGTPAAGLTLSVVDNLSSIWSLDTTINLSASDISNLSYSVAIDNLFVLFVNGNFVDWENSMHAAAWSKYASLLFLRPGGNDIRVVIGGDDDGNEAGDYFAFTTRDDLTNILFGTSYSGNALIEILRGNSETNLHNFTGQANGDGSNPLGDLVLSGDTLYGVTEQGGMNGYGAIFSQSTSGSNYMVLYSFSNSPDGSNPEAGLILNGDTLYGTAAGGGVNGGGTVFSISTAGTNYEVLHSFPAFNDDGFRPYGRLVLSNNTLYGTSQAGGANSSGTIFSMNVSGSNYVVLHSFVNGSDGASPYGGLVLQSNILFGTTYNGGTNDNGTVFSISTSGTNFEVLHTFTNTPDGSSPEAGLALSGNTLYGTTWGGGAAGNGTIFKINVDGSGYTNVLSFGVTDDGDAPTADLLVLGSYLFGTTYYGGAGNSGMVFRVGTNGAGLFDLYDGGNPRGGVCSP